MPCVSYDNKREEKRSQVISKDTKSLGVARIIRLFPCFVFCFVLAGMTGGFLNGAGGEIISIGLK